MPLVSVDDPATWPPEVLGRVCVRASALAGSTEFTSDLPIDPDDEDEFRALLMGHLLVVYHATRLLDHEIDAIRRDGLLPLSEELVRTRIEAAHDLGYLTHNERNQLLARNLFVDGSDVSIREGQVCFFLSRQVLEDEVHGVWNPLTIWGGEGIFFGQFDEEVEARLRGLGRPAITVAAIELSDGWRTHPVYPGAFKSFLGRKLELEEYGSDVFYRAAVPGHQVIDVWLPGHREYERHNELPSL